MQPVLTSGSGRLGRTASMWDQFQQQTLDLARTQNVGENDIQDVRRSSRLFFSIEAVVHFLDGSFSINISY